MRPHQATIGVVTPNATAAIAARMTPEVIGERGTSRVSHLTTRSTKCWGSHDITINTVTLGGMTIAIGALVHDAIIDARTCFAGCARTPHIPSPSGARPIP
jgi:hypothetical protein